MSKKLKKNLQLWGNKSITVDITIHQPETQKDGCGRVVGRVSETHNVYGQVSLGVPVKVIGIRAKATCDPDDDWDEKHGVELVKDRIMEKALRHMRRHMERLSKHLLQMEKNISEKYS